MASPDYQTPNLASILQTLAAYAPPQPPPYQPPPQTHPPPALEEDEYDPSTFQPSLSLPPQPPQPLPTQPIQPTPPNPTPQAQAPLITTYPPALRHTTKLLSSSPTTVSRIRHLIHTAHQHERSWYSGRETLLKQLSGRDASRKQLDTVLASLGGATTTSHSSAPGEEKVDVEKELEVYDRKVYRAYGEMVKATQRELRGLGIPFFGIEGALVVREEGEKEKGKVGEEELERLKARMVEFLEDMVRE
ncbi:MAG: hypothetical protein LQ338_000778 [Usnochroma carphineum]|nr:MAG: hypothetical protein LQ338_000778 [Usnochroma carphineum]